MSVNTNKKVIDSRGSFCPGPITDLFRAYRASNIGDEIEVWATDPAAKSDISAWAARSGNQVLDIIDEQGYTRIIVKITKKRS
jgi:tRNA 2-thiouridine synthesizing protein A